MSKIPSLNDGSTWCDVTYEQPPFEWFVSTSYQISSNCLKQGAWLGWKDLVICVRTAPANALSSAITALVISVMAFPLIWEGKRALLLTLPWAWCDSQISWNLIFLQQGLELEWNDVSWEVSFANVRGFRVLSGYTFEQLNFDYILRWLFRSKRY